MERSLTPSIIPFRQTVQSIETYETVFQIAQHAIKDTLQIKELSLAKKIFHFLSFKRRVLFSFKIRFPALRKSDYSFCIIIRPT